MFDLESAIKNWLKTFSEYRSFDHGSVREMELHIRDHIDDLLAEGLSEKEAFEKAIEEFGDIKPMAKDEFNNLRSPNRIRSFFFGIMLRNYFKTSMRSMLRNPMSSFINIFGLSVAIGICLVVYSFLEFDYSIDDFHEYGDQVYLVTHYVDRDGTLEHNGTAPRPLGEMMLTDFPQVDRMTRIEDRKVVIKNSDKVFHESIRLVDPDFLHMFTFPLKWGNREELKDLNTIILSDRMSEKYFGTQNPVGSDIVMIFNSGETKTFRVGGVAREFPDNHIIEFDFLVNFKNMEMTDPGYDLNDWSEFIRGMLVMIEKPEDLQRVKDNMSKYQEVQNAAQSDWTITGFGFEPLATLHDRSTEIRYDISYNDSAPGRIFLPIFGIFILVLACINYMNMAIVSSSKRLKEIGIRKVVGASRWKVIVQFISENIFMTAFAFIFGILLAINLFLPWFSKITEWSLKIEFLEPNLWIFIIALLLITGVISGLYPAIYISRFQATTILKGTVRFGKKNPLTKIFLSLQLIVAIILITSAVIFTQNTHYQNNRSWGYNQKNTVYAQTPNIESYERLRQRITANPDVISVAGAEEHLGKTHGKTVVSLNDRQYEVLKYGVSPEYLELMEIELLEGRFFKADHESDKETVIINEQFALNLDIYDPVGKSFRMDSIQFEIIGVVKNFHYYNFYYEMEPVLFRVSDEEDYAYLTVKTKSGTKEEVFGSLQEEWTSLFPTVPFNGGYQEDVWGVFFHEVDNQEVFTRSLAIIAILLASLGLYGLVTLNVTGRIREFSIRKVLGAGIVNLTRNISRQYYVITLVAILIGTPLSYLFTQSLMYQMYPDPIPMNPLQISIAVIILLSTIFAVISTQIRKVMKSNPVEGLKVE